jgi:predicted peroxiredoxin
MRSTIALVLACMAATLAGTGVAAGQDAKLQRDGIMIHISHGRDDPHRLLMALNMATMMSDDHDVLVYFDISGVEAVLKDTQDISFSPFTPLKAQLTELQRRGVTLMACPGCLKAAGKTPADLLTGVRVADKSGFFSFTKGRILTLDY